MHLHIPEHLSSLDLAHLTVEVIELKQKYCESQKSKKILRNAITILLAPDDGSSLLSEELDEKGTQTFESFSKPRLKECSSQTTVMKRREQVSSEKKETSTLQKKRSIKHNEIANNKRPRVCYTDGGNENKTGRKCDGDHTKSIRKSQGHKQGESQFSNNYRTKIKKIDQGNEIEITQKTVIKRQQFQVMDDSSKSILKNSYPDSSYSKNRNIQKTPLQKSQQYKEDELQVKTSQLIDDRSKNILKNSYKDCQIKKVKDYRAQKSHHKQHKLQVKKNQKKKIKKTHQENESDKNTVIEHQQCKLTDDRSKNILKDSNKNSSYCKVKKVTYCLIQKSKQHEADKLKVNDHTKKGEKIHQKHGKETKSKAIVKLQQSELMEDSSKSILRKSNKDITSSKIVKDQMQKKQSHLKTVDNMDKKVESPTKSSSYKIKMKKMPKTNGQNSNIKKISNISEKQNVMIHNHDIIAHDRIKSLTQGVKFSSGRQKEESFLKDENSLVRTQSLRRIEDRSLKEETQDELCRKQHIKSKHGENRLVLKSNLASSERSRKTGTDQDFVSKNKCLLSNSSPARIIPNGYFTDQKIKINRIVEPSDTVNDTKEPVPCFFNIPFKYPRIIKDSIEKGEHLKKLPETVDIVEEIKPDKERVNDQLNKGNETSIYSTGKEPVCGKDYSSTSRNSDECYSPNQSLSLHSYPSTAKSPMQGSYSQKESISLDRCPSPRHC